MAMSIPADGGGEDQVASAINTTPVVDVMLVLLNIVTGRLVAEPQSHVSRALRQ